MAITIQQILYTDPQEEPAVAFCPHCGREIYSGQSRCLRCERRYHDPETDEPGI